MVKMLIFILRCAGSWRGTWTYRTEKCVSEREKPNWSPPLEWGQSVRKTHCVFRRPAAWEVEGVSIGFFLSIRIIQSAPLEKKNVMFFPSTQLVKSSKGLERRMIFTLSCSFGCYFLLFFCVFFFFSLSLLIFFSHWFPLLYKTICGSRLSPSFLSPVSLVDSN